jgi:hypothetical protein
MANVKQNADEVVVKAEEVVVLEEKTVKVKPKKTVGDVFVGAGWLTIEKDKEIEVTQDQKRCLLEADVLYI